MSGIITLTTDFGRDSAYVAAMKGVMLSVDPSARLIDISHSIGPQDVRQGAIVLDEATRWFPPGTIHVAVVDPGVGSGRRILYARVGEQQYLAPDNGLLSRVIGRAPPSLLVEVSEPAYWREEVSATFHGRDIFAPVAARLALGLDPALLGPAAGDIVRLSWPEVRIMPSRITGSVRSIDSFGNLVTDITAEMLAGASRGEGTIVQCDEHETTGIYQTYSDQPEMTLIALVGSSGYLELAIVGDSAAAMLGVRVGEKVEVIWG
jgi:S-adenosylmethionine hydrolase